MTNFMVFYCKNPDFRVHDGLSWPNLNEDYAKVATVAAGDLEEVFVAMQGENWSPNGEARDLIRDLGLMHTSMSVGDMILDCSTRNLYCCDMVGFKLIGKLQMKGA